MLSSEKLKRIKVKTGYDLDEIVRMDNGQFFFEITRLLSKGTLSPKQYEFLAKRRDIHRSGGEQTTIDAISTFGGKIIG